MKQSSGLVSDGKKPIIILLIAFSIVTIALADSIYEDFIKLDEELKQGLDKMTDALVDRLKDYEHVVYAGRGFNAGSEQITFEEWDVFIKSLELSNRFDDSITVSYVGYVNSNNKENFELEMQKEIENYEIIPESSSEFYFPIKYISPYSEELEFLIGYDNAFEEKRRLCSLESVEIKKPVLSEILILNQDIEDPIYASLICHTIFSDIEKNSPEGFVTLAFRYDPILKNVFEELFGSDADKFQMKIEYEGRTVYDYNKSTNFGKNEFSQYKDITILNKDLRLTLDNLEGFSVSNLSYVVAIIGYLLVGLAYIATKKYIENKIKIELEETEKEIIKEQTREKIVRLQELDKQKSEFTSMITHELKTPLGPIFGYCEVLTHPKFRNKMTDEQLDMVKKIENSAKTLQVLIDDLLLIQKLVLGKITIKNEKFTLKKFIQEIIELHNNIIKEKNIKMQFNVDDITLNSDKLRLGEIINNLINNSIDFVSENTGLIEINAHKDGDKVKISIKDNGIGIKKEDQSSLFTEFYQVDTTLRRKHGGTGLGLAICKRLTELLGGQIWVESEVGKFTKMTFTVLVDNNRINENNF
ncbi:MAG: ATP-binding protein [Nitrosopumilus sp.]